MRSTFLRALVVAGVLAAVVAVSGQEVSSSTGGIDEFEVSSSSAGVDVGTNEVFSSSAVGEALIVVESSSSSASSAEMTVDSSSAAVTVDSSSAAVTVDSSVASSTAAEALTSGVVESSSAAGEALGNVVESSTAGGVVVPPNSVESSTAAAAGEGTPGNVVESSTAVAGGASTPTTVESSSAADQAAPGTPGNAVESSTAVAGGVAPSNSVQSSTAVEVVPPQSVESSTAAAGVVTPGNVAQSSSSTAAALGPFRALDPSVSPNGAIRTPNGQFYLPVDADSSFVVPAGATSITLATFTIVGANDGALGNLVLFTSSNGGTTHTAVGLSENITPCATAGCTMTAGPLTFIDPLNGNAPVEVTGGQIVGLYLSAAVQNSFGYDTTAAGTFRAANFDKVMDIQTQTYPSLGASDFFTPTFNGALLFDVEYGYPTSSSTAGAAANTNVVASSTAVNGASAGAAGSSSSTGGANNVAASSSSSSSSSSSGDVRRLVASSSSSTGPRVVDSSTIPAWVFNISSSGINGGGGCIPGLTCAAPHAASSSVGMILAAAVVALVAAFAQ